MNLVLDWDERMARTQDRETVARVLEEVVIQAKERVQAVLKEFQQRQVFLESTESESKSESESSETQDDSEGEFGSEEELEESTDEVWVPSWMREAEKEDQEANLKENEKQLGPRGGLHLEGGSGMSLSLMITREPLLPCPKLTIDLEATLPKVRLKLQWEQYGTRVLDRSGKELHVYWTAPGWILAVKGRVRVGSHWIRCRTALHTTLGLEPFAPEKNDPLLPRRQVQNRLGDMSLVWRGIESRYYSPWTGAQKRLWIGFAIPEEASYRRIGIEVAVVRGDLQEILSKGISKGLVKDLGSIPAEVEAQVKRIRIGF